MQHLTAVQMQIQSVASKKNLTPIDQAALHRLYEEQKRILLTGRVVPTIPGQHAVGLPLVSKTKVSLQRHWMSQQYFWPNDFLHLLLYN